MFTGLISDIAEIARIERGGEGWQLDIHTSYDIASIELGESIAVDGACLTVTATATGQFSVDASPETLRRTTLGDRRVGDRVHLERALRVGDRMGGHMVLGHVDGVGTVQARSREKNAWLLEVDAPEAVAEFLIEKGSITVDGVSLTVNWVRGERFGLAIIPHTAEETNLADYAVGRRVNLEADVLGKYVKKFVAPHADAAGVSLDQLEAAGFGSGD